MEMQKNGLVHNNSGNQYKMFSLSSNWELLHSHNIDLTLFQFYHLKNQKYEYPSLYRLAYHLVSIHSLSPAIMGGVCFCPMDTGLGYMTCFSHWNVDGSHSAPLLDRGLNCVIPIIPLSISNLYHECSSPDGCYPSSWVQEWKYLSHLSQPMPHRYLCMK